VATIVVVVVCGGTDRGAGNNGYGEGGHRVATARGPHPRRIKTPPGVTLRDERPREGSLAGCQQPSFAATATADRLARGPGLRPLQPRAARTAITGRSGPGDIFGGTSAAAAAQTPLNDDAPPKIR